MCIRDSRLGVSSVYANSNAIVISTLCPSAGEVCLCSPYTLNLATDFDFDVCDRICETGQLHYLTLGCPEVCDATV